jgi:hypothetical protein
MQIKKLVHSTLSGLPIYFVLNCAFRIAFFMILAFSRC